MCIITLYIYVYILFTFIAKHCQHISISIYTEYVSISIEGTDRGQHINYIY